MNFLCIIKLLFLLSSTDLYEVLLQIKGLEEIQENPLKQQRTYLQVTPRCLVSRTELVLTEGLCSSFPTEGRNSSHKMVGCEHTGKRKQHECVVKNQGPRQFLSLEGVFEWLTIISCKHHYKATQVKNLHMTKKYNRQGSTFFELLNVKNLIGFRDLQVTLPYYI